MMILPPPLYSIKGCGWRSKQEVKLVHQVEAHFTLFDKPASQDGRKYTSSANEFKVLLKSLGPRIFSPIFASFHRFDSFLFVTL